MKPAARLSPLLAPLLVWLTAVPARADSLTPSGDATINLGSPKTNYGSASTVTVSANGPQYGLVQFDLSPLPSNTTLAKVTLRLYVTSVNTAGTLNARTVTSLSFRRVGRAPAR